jgi:arabinan endo-1,5-alpha-L-arabinosidase
VAVNNDGDMSVYLDGVQMFSGANFPDVFSPMINPRFWIGVNHWDPAYTGLVDELKFFDEALTADDVARLFAEDAGM